MVKIIFLGCFQMSGMIVKTIFWGAGRIEWPILRQFQKMSCEQRSDSCLHSHDGVINRSGSVGGASRLCGARLSAELGGLFWFGVAVLGDGSHLSGLEHLVMLKFGSEPWFEPELMRTGPKFTSKFTVLAEPNAKSSSAFR